MTRYAGEYRNGQFYFKPVADPLDFGRIQEARQAMDNNRIWSCSDTNVEETIRALLDKHIHGR